MDHLKDYRNTALFPMQATNAEAGGSDILSSLFDDKTSLHKHWNISPDTQENPRRTNTLHCWHG